MRNLLYAAAIFTLCAATATLSGCRSAPPAAVVAAPDGGEAARRAELEMRFTDVSLRKYINTFPGFYARTREMLELDERDPRSEIAQQKIHELSKLNAEHVAAKGWSGMDVFVEFNGKVVYFLTVYLVLKRFSRVAPRTPQAKARHLGQMKILESDLGKEGLAALKKNAERIRRMYIRSGLMEMRQFR